MVLTNTLSITFRIFGASLSMVLYGFGVSSALIGISVPAVVSFLVALPAPVVLLGKAAIAVPFSYHWLNGIRHLFWDLGIGLSLKGTYIGGYAVLLATAAASLAMLLC
jgi:succinate dehydrogenase (ubiquinone) cytochrome b560 subunit